MELETAIAIFIAFVFDMRSQFLQGFEGKQAAIQIVCGGLDGKILEFDKHRPHFVIVLVLRFGMVHFVLQQFDPGVEFFDFIAGIFPDGALAVADGKNG